jgi:hypothetical protein
MIKAAMPLPMREQEIPQKLRDGGSLELGPFDDVSSSCSRKTKGDGFLVDLLSQ